MRKNKGHRRKLASVKIRQNLPRSTLAMTIYQAKTSKIPLEKSLMQGVVASVSYAQTFRF